MSLIDIQNAISNMPVVVNGKTVASWKLDEVKNVVETADLPRRMMLPVGGDGGEGSSGIEYTGFGGGLNITWRITELMLWTPTAQGPGRRVMSELTAYISAYAQAIKGLRFPTENSMFTNFQPSAGVFTWPAGGSRDYFGVRCVFSVAETIC